MNLDVDENVALLADRARAFVEEHVIPLEDEHHGDIERAGGDSARRDLQAKARAAGLLSPHAPKEYGGLGLGMVERAPVFEAAGYALFGPLALNIAAPDEGNLHLLAHVAQGEQRERFLRPLAEGRVRSAFAMTEPPPGAGSDPAALDTTAERSGRGWTVSGRKRFITGADGADFLILMARTSGAPGDRGGATMFIVPADRPGIRIDRHIETIDRSMLGGHCELTFDGLTVDEDDVLGEVDAGFANAQVRLGPARMTHTMRWLGASIRAHEFAVRRAYDRRLFGQRLADLGMAQQMIADNEIDIAASRGLIVQACWDLDTAGDWNDSTSIAKTFVAEAVGRIVDRAAQLCGGDGVSFDGPIARLLHEVRPFRIYDGPSETHRWAIAKRAVRRIARRPDDRPSTTGPTR